MDEAKILKALFISQQELESRSSVGKEWEESGLGVAIIKRIIKDNMNGSIRVEKTK